MLNFDDARWRALYLATKQDDFARIAARLNKIKKHLGGKHDQMAHARGGVGTEAGMNALHQRGVDTQVAAQVAADLGAKRIPAKAAAARLQAAGFEGDAQNAAWRAQDAIRAARKKAAPKSSQPQCYSS